MRHAICVATVVCGVAGFAAEARAKAPYVEVEPGKTYVAGARIGAGAVSVVIPKGWSGALPEGSEALVLTSSARDDVTVFVTVETALTDATVTTRLSEPIPISEALALLPEGAPTRKKKGEYAQTYASALSDEVFGEARVTLEPAGGRGLVAVALGATSARAMSVAALSALSKSVRFHAAPKPSREGASAGAISGKRLVYRRTSSGQTTMRRFDFCASGRVHYRFEETYLSGGFSSAGEDAKVGAWSVRGSTLEITWSDGAGATWEVTKKSSGAVSLDGDPKWSHDGDAICP